ncbi:HAD family hydrolase [Spartinivicinus poritis]|uniref:HAD-IA family hydrolase n=1 Tax=Spartinivicinus poritis TaxID=2994640 RepID=A0ABT5UFV8_9GAMM|nr:HAD-IA family hydrolase [Spartinivicinus sp. A2-2]MDE1465262.1 HAD-IA family hydrolase [Spartinivicinus sp. A2-2]
MTIKAITFDLDDTLWNNTPVLLKAERAVIEWLLAQFPNINDHHDIDTTTGEFREFKDQIKQANPALTHQVTNLRKVALEELLGQAGYTEQATNGAEQAMEVFLHARHQVNYFDYVESVLAELNQQYTLGVLTNGNVNIKRLSIGDYFDFAFCADELNTSKPDPVFFQAGIQAAKVLAEEIVHIGDHPEYDVIGAKEVGLKAIWFNPEQSSWDYHIKPDAVISCLSELPKAIKRIKI